MLQIPGISCVICLLLLLPVDVYSQSKQERSALKREVNSVLRSAIRDFPKAIEYFQPLLEDAESLYPKPHSDVSQYYTLFGSMLYQTGRFADSEIAFAKATEIADQIADFPASLRANLVSERATTLLQLGKFSESQEMLVTQVQQLTSALNINKDLPMPMTPPGIPVNTKILLGRLYEKLGESYMGQTQWEKALVELESAYHIYREVGVPDPMLVFLLRSIAHTNSRLGNGERALETINRAIENYEKFVPLNARRHSAILLSVKATAQRINGDYEEALATLEEARLQNESGGNRIAMNAEIAFKKAGLREMMGREKAFTALEEAIRFELELANLGLAKSDGTDVYKMLIGLRDAADRIPRFIDPKSRKSVTRAFDLAVRFKGIPSRLLTYRIPHSGNANATPEVFGNSLASAITLTGFIREHLERQLADDQVLIEIFQMHWDYHAFVIYRKEQGVAIDYYNLGTVEAINPLIDLFREELIAVRSVDQQSAEPSRNPAGVGVKRHNPSRLQEVSESLRKILLSKWEGKLAGKKRMVFCGDGKLSIFPWSALPVDDTGTPLIQKYEISTETSAQEYLRIHAQDVVPLSRFLAVGALDYNQKVTVPENSEFASASPKSQGDSFAALSQSGLEIRTIVSFWGDRPTKVLHGRQATEATLFAERQPGQVLHFATHGRYYSDVDLASLPESRYRSNYLQDDPMVLSAVALSGANLPAKSRVGYGDGLLTGEEVLKIGFPDCPLVFLSSCDGALGEIRNADGVIGIQRAFQMAGCRTVVVNQWQVSDRMAVEFNSLFYKFLLMDGYGKAKSLQMAQQEMIKRGIAPRHWAGWVLSGDTR